MSRQAVLSVPFGDWPWFRKQSRTACANCDEPSSRDVPTEQVFEVDERFCSVECVWDLIGTVMPSDGWVAVVEPTLIARAHELLCEEWGIDPDDTASADRAHREAPVEAFEGLSSSNGWVELPATAVRDALVDRLRPEPLPARMRRTALESMSIEVRRGSRHEVPEDLVPLLTGWLETARDMSLSGPVTPDQVTGAFGSIEPLREVWGDATVRALRHHFAESHGYPGWVAPHVADRFHAATKMAGISKRRSGNLLTGNATADQSSAYFNAMLTGAEVDPDELARQRREMHLGMLVDPLRTCIEHRLVSGHAVMLLTRMVWEDMALAPEDEFDQLVVLTEAGATGIHVRPHDWSVLHDVDERVPTGLPADADDPAAVVRILGRIIRERLSLR
ncbi:hypothetical protein DVS28_b0614 (plasmid) [Euzebya pacifica]|uniref:Uncharacterized protein n=1 Tax=Euzebya pacifica TaxID=1608957 RepID=A0A346Y7A7_9ACTN|nr:hypothetical protein [Euzebya pacifica]AXV10354.1 hypothetical protein DVS28_b0614 [Euzebya pacifica]